MMCGPLSAAWPLWVLLVRSKFPGIATDRPVRNSGQWQNWFWKAEKGFFKASVNQFRNPFVPVRLDVEILCKPVRLKTASEEREGIGQFVAVRYRNPPPFLATRLRVLGTK
jgi:hypothetical protein